MSRATYACCSLAFIAFSKRKLCNGENFRIKDFDEFRCFWGFWVRIIGLKKMYVCMYCNGVAKQEVSRLSEAIQGNLLGCPRLSPRHSFRTFSARFQCRKLRLLFLLEQPLSAGAAAARRRCCQLLHVNARELCSALT